MGYKVIHYFEDLQDFNHQYKVGDIFPRLGMVVTDARLKELSSKNNKQGKPLIEKIEEKEPLEEIEKTYTKTEINRMSTAELQELAKAEDVEDAENITGAELKKILIEKFDL